MEVSEWLYGTPKEKPNIKTVTLKILSYINSTSVVCLKFITCCDNKSVQNYNGNPYENFGYVMLGPP